MSELKSSHGWIQTTLGAILPISYGKGLTKAKRNSEGDVPVYGSSGKVGIHDIAFTSNPSLIIGRKGSVGTVHYSQKPCWPIDTVYFVEGTDSTDLLFFKYLLSHLGLGYLDRSTTIPGLNRDDYNAVSTLIPPLPEQQRIVEAIESYLTRLDDAVASLERVKANLGEDRASVLKAAVEGRLVPTEADLARQERREYEPASELLTRILAERKRRWIDVESERARARVEVGARKKGKPWTDEDDRKALEQARGTAEKKYQDPALPDSDGLAELPEGWCWVSPGQLFSWSSGNSLTTKMRRDGNIPVFGGHGIAGFHDTALTSKPTIVIGRVGAHCGNIHVTDGPAWITDNAIYAIEIPSHARLGYWRLVLGYMNLNANAAGTGQPYVNQKHINGLVIPFPPLAEQVRIAEEVEKHSSVENHVEAELEAINHRNQQLRQSILKWAFEGRLVDQDPTDEPASVLLDRIKAERADAPKRRGKKLRPKSGTQGKLFEDGS